MRNHLKYDYIIPKLDDPHIIYIVTDTLKNATQSQLDNAIKITIEKYFKRFNCAIGIVITKLG
jgi:hypothetical protein